ncbi:MAG: glycosyltransferase family 4 protein [Thermodesulfobacteriota bacterium]
MKDRPRIAIISNTASSLIHFRGPLIKQLVKRGTKIYALAPDYSPKVEEEVRALGATPVSIRLNRTGMNPFQDFWNSLSLWCLLCRLRPNILLSYTIKPVIYGTLAAWLANIPRRVALIEGLGYAFTESEDKSIKKRILKFIVHYLTKTALGRAHNIVFLNPDDMAEFIELQIIKYEKAFLLGAIGVPLEEWPVSPPVLEPITFTLAARLLREKGIVEFVDAASMIKKKYPQTHFILLGGLDSNPGALKQEEIESLVKEANVEWHGHVPDIRPYLAKTSVYVLPSYREGVPRSSQEAMAMGRPVITTDVPGCRETVIDGLNGFLIPPRDPVSLAQAMERFIHEPELIERMGRESRRLAEEPFDAAKINERFISFILGY